MTAEGAVEGALRATAEQWAECVGHMNRAYIEVNGWRVVPLAYAVDHSNLEDIFPAFALWVENLSLEVARPTCKLWWRRLPEIIRITSGWQIDARLAYMNTGFISN